MSKTLEQGKAYKGYKLCNQQQYTLKTDNMRDILKSLTHARDTIDRPIALRYTIGLDDNHSFDINKLTRKIKSSFRHTGYSFIYSFEYAEAQKGLHLEVLFTCDRSIYSPERVFNIFRGYLFNMDGVSINNDDVNREGYECVSLNFHERKEEYIHTSGGSKVGHNLKDEAQFIDCVYRASYLSKQDDKDNVQYRKTFGTTRG